MFQNKYRFHGIHLLTICEPSPDTFQPIFSGCVGLFIECVSSQGCYISLHWRLELRENDFLCARRAKSQEEGKRNTFFWKLVELSQKREWKIFLHIPHFVLLLCFFLLRWSKERTQRRANELSSKEEEKWSRISSLVQRQTQLATTKRPMMSSSWVCFLLKIFNKFHVTEREDNLFFCFTLHLSFWAELKSATGGREVIFTWRWVWTAVAHMLISLLLP